MIPVAQVKLMIRMNHADRQSTLRGILPKNDPPLIRNSNDPFVKQLTAKIVVIKAIRKTEMILITGLIIAGTKIRAIITETKTMENAKKRKPINSLPS
jgi:hypothetical protein